VSDIVDVLETWEAATVVLPVNEGLRLDTVREA
jgi:hypothetical protein